MSLVFFFFFFSSAVLFLLCDQPVLILCSVQSTVSVMKVGLGALIKHAMKEGHAISLRVVCDWQQ